MITFLLLLMTVDGFVPAASAEDLKAYPWAMTDWKELGLEVRQGKAGNQKVITIVDRVAKETTEIRRENLVPGTKGLEREVVTDRSASGKILKTYTREPGRLIDEDFRKSPATRIERTFLADRSQDVVHFAMNAGKWKPVRRYHLPSKAAQECNWLASSKEMEGRLAKLTDPLIEWTTLASVWGDTYTVLDNNTRAWGCNTYPDGGTANFVADLEGAMNQGMRCMDNLFQHYVKSDETEYPADSVWDIRSAMRRILGNFIDDPETPFHFVCEDGPEEYIYDDGVNAYAMTCVSPEGEKESGDHVPGVALNTEALAAKSVTERRATIFHELVHHAGLFHHTEDGLEDHVYNLQFCCFGTDDNPKTLPKKAKEISAFPGQKDVSCRQIMRTNHGDPVPDSDHMIEEYTRKRVFNVND